jgi:Isoleucyl-tRNA synthetase (EC 6.1.1.5)
MDYFFDNTLIKEVDADFARYEPTRAGRKIQTFVEDNLSNWYVRLCRRRFWKSDDAQDKLAAYQTLYSCLVAVSKLMAPIAPFYADRLYLDLNKATKLEAFESVHLSTIPAIDEEAIDLDLEERMGYAQRISSMVLSLRKDKDIRVRQPLQKILIPILDSKFKDQIEQVKDLILAEVNVKDIEYIEDTEGIISKKAKPNFKTLGRRMGKNMKQAAALINQFDAKTIQTLEQTNAFDIEIGGETYTLTSEDIEILTEDIPGWLVASDGPLTVALDITISDELEAEGIARELVNRIQNLRKSKVLT